MTNNNLVLKILVDNKVNGQLIEEHGFAVWIEVAGLKLLFDTGQGKALIPNATALGCELSQLDALILSHGHFDHCGSISKLLEVNPDLNVFAHPGTLSPRYRIKPGEPARNISVPQVDRDALLELGDNRMNWITQPFNMLPGIGITGSIERRHPLEDTGGPFYLDPAGRVHDPIIDDMSIWIKTERGLIILTGCCHSGLINTVEHIRRISGVDRVRGIVGGLHLLNASRERIKSTCDALTEWKPDFVVPCHCTGADAIEILQSVLGDVVTPGFSGLDLICFGNFESPELNS